MKLFAKKNTGIIICLAPLLLLIVLKAQAVQVRSLYEAELPVANTSSDARAQLLPVALQQVLIKVSGNSAICTIPAIKSELANANSYIDSYSYQPSPSLNDPQLWLVAKFDANAINKILTGANQAWWGHNRPSLLVWADVVEEQGESKILGDDDGFASVIDQNAKRRGLPITMPTMDLVDMNALTATDLVALNVEKIKAASARYSPDAILAGAITQNSASDWQSKWVLIDHGQVTNWQVSAESEEEIIAHITDTVADQLAARYAIFRGSGFNQVLTVVISGIGDLSQYSQVVNYLQGLNAVRKVELVDLEPNTIKLAVTCDGGADAFKAALNANKMVAIPEPALTTDQPATPSDNNELQYQWVARGHE